MPMIECAWCHKLFEKSQKRIIQTEKMGKRHACSRKCASALVNELRRCEPTTKNAAKTRRDKIKYPRKDKARLLVREAVRSGRLVPLTECELCGSDGVIEAHHPDHEQPFLLVYLCKTKCHPFADAQPDKLISLATDYSGPVGYNRAEVSHEEIDI